MLNWSWKFISFMVAVCVVATSYHVRVEFPFLFVTYHLYHIRGGAGASRPRCPRSYAGGVSHRAKRDIIPKVYHPLLRERISFRKSASEARINPSGHPAPGAASFQTRCFQKPSPQGEGFFGVVQQGRLRDSSARSRLRMNGGGAGGASLQKMLTFPRFRVILYLSVCLD